MRGSRFIAAALLALMLVSGLFAALRAVVAVRLGDLERRPAARIEFTRLRRDSEVRTLLPEKVQRPAAPAAPSLPQISRLSPGSAKRTPSVALGVSVNARIAPAQIGISAGSDRDATPLVRVDPDYPVRASQRGVEGWVRVQFTITSAGQVVDPAVVDSQPKGVFEATALRAVSRWRYSPKVDSGSAVERRGVQVLLTFQLEQ